MELFIDIVQIVASVLFVGSLFVAMAWRVKRRTPDDSGTYQLVYREPAGPRGVVEDDFAPWDFSRLHRPATAARDPQAPPDGSQEPIRTGRQAMSNGKG